MQGVTGKLGVIAIVLAGMCNACVKEKKPEALLDKKEMTNFLVEVYLAEARLSSTIFVPDSARHVFQPYEKLLLQRRGIQDTVLKQSYEYYIAHPTEMEEIMDAVIDSLSLRETATQVKVQ